MGKIFEKHFRFHVKHRTTGNVLYLVFSNFLLVLTKYSFREGD